MSEENKKTLPKDFDSDYTMPGRLEESNSKYFDTDPVESKSKNRSLVIATVIFVIFSSVFFSYYFVNQNEIDTRIIQNAIHVDPERGLVSQYNVGEYGSEHAHAAFAIFINGEQINFGQQQFQLSSKYIHFENHNPYIIHKHATGVPLEMLFTSLGMRVTTECIMLYYDVSSDNKNNIFCTSENQLLTSYVNGEKYSTDISQYVLKHNDRIMISFGDAQSISKHLAYLESLDIFDVPQKNPQYSENKIFI